MWSLSKTEAFVLLGFLTWSDLEVEVQMDTSKFLNATGGKRNLFRVCCICVKGQDSIISRCLLTQILRVNMLAPKGTNNILKARPSGMFSTVLLSA